MDYAKFMHLVTCFAAFIVIAAPLLWPVIIGKRSSFTLHWYFEFYFALTGMSLLFVAWFAILGQISTSILIVALIHILGFLLIRLKEKKLQENRLRFSDFLEHWSLKAFGGWRFLLLPSIALMAYRIFKSFQYGDTAWDSNQQHLPIVFSMFQTDSIRQLPAVGYFQNIPALPHLYSTVGLFINGNVHVPLLIQSIVDIFFMTYLITSINQLVIDKVIQKRVGYLAFIAVIFNAPLLMTVGTHYVDLFSQLALLMLCQLVLRRLRKTSFQKFDYFLIVSTVSIVLSSKVAATYQLIPLFIFLALNTFLKEDKGSRLRSLLKILMAGLVGVALGCVFYVRNFLEFANPFYPYNLNSNIRFKNYLVDYPTMVSWLRNAAAAQVQNMNQISGMIWNWFKADFVWLSEHLHALSQILHGGDGFNSFGAGSVYALDARVVGSGITFNVIFIFGLLSYFSKGFIRPKQTLQAAVILIPALMAICVPNFPSMRYLWAASGLFVLTSLIEISGWKKLTTFSLIIVSTLSVISFCGATVASTREYAFAKSQHLQLSGLDNISPIYRPIRIYSNSSDWPKCPTVQLDSSLQSVSFASALWLGSSCTKVVTKSNKSLIGVKPDLHAIAVKASDANRRCLISNEVHSTSIEDAWAISIVLLIPDADLKNELARLGCLAS
jgi:hypothetical protein